ncbi:NAD-dependent succinate-semialdehyde dehydrogenase [Nocardioides massiliensis]|uniref:NAD-dependent succinate-semialdehyde dehydrogenase n=1 Tax=Nocardioides massiliensis TaxID=1325935 RepID=UPI000837318E|nr:NAD-dependent succinate-semialdehyde dehydrogenase [Nocardioides massiliensis]
MLVGGAWRETVETFVVSDPATGETLAQVADGTPDDAVAALDAAAAAQDDWAATDPRERAEILRRAFDLLQERSESVATVMTAEMGKPYAEAQAEVSYGGEFLRWFSEEAVRIAGRWSTAPTGGTRLLTMKQPVGPTYAITPWNFPLAMGTRKIAPALAAGCTIVLKPAGATPLTSLLLGQILLDAGLPPGVLGIITSSSSSAVTAPLLADPRLRKLTFTGSTEVGRALLEQSAAQVLRTSMELGGNAPFVVCADADLEAAVDGAMTAKMRNVGEACTAANRFLVHADLAEDFSRALAERMSALVPGHGLDEHTTLGPLIDDDAVAKAHELIEDATRAGARIAAGGRALDGDGSFLGATVLTDVPASARILTEEVFAPVAPITTFTDDDAAIAAANDTEYGLVSYVFTTNLSRAIRYAERLDAGMVGVNQGVVSNPAAPFGGVKQSGLGREGGLEGIEEYLETKYVGLKL